MLYALAGSRKPVLHTDALDSAFKPQEESRARVAVLFSGGIDSSAVAFLADRHVPRDEPIDLLNVAFENPRKLKAALPKPARNHKGRVRPERNNVEVPEPTYMVPDRVTGLEELEELRALCPHRRWNFVRLKLNIFLDCDVLMDALACRLRST